MSDYTDKTSTIPTSIAIATALARWSRVVAIETAVAREGLSWIWLQLFDKKKKERKKERKEVW